MEGNIMDSSTKAPNLDNYFIQKQFEFMLESNNKKVAKEMANMRAIINKLNEEIDNLKKNFDSIRTRPAEFSPVQPRETHQNVQQNIQASATITGRNEEPLKPRFGDYTPEDVPIGKFFYFGNKRA